MPWEQLPYINTNLGKIDFFQLVNPNLNDQTSVSFPNNEYNLYVQSTPLFDVIPILNSMSDNTTRDYYLSNGNYVRVTRTDYRTGGILLNSSDGTFIDGLTVGGYNEIRHWYILLAYNSDTEFLQLRMLRQYLSYTWYFETGARRDTNKLSWLTGSFPIIYNYEPINYITGNNKALKLSMIKATNTNHGESVTDGTTTDIQRFTDATNMRAFCSDMVENDVKILGYTAANNYVTVTKGYVDGNGAYTVTFKYYINGVHQISLDHTARVTSDSIPSEPVWTPYYSLLLDTEHSACRPSRIYLNEQTNTVRYNDSENDQNVITDANQALWFEWLADGYRTETSGPYDYGGTSEPDSGDGQWDNTSENIDIPSIPSVSISDTGFVSVFNPTLSQVKALADYMWAGAFDVNLFKKVMANPMDSIIGFALIPCEPTISGVDTVKVGNIDTGVSMNAVSNQFVDVDCGTLDMQQYWGNYLDYAPYTKISLVLPFIGTVHLSPDDCMKKKIGIKYRIDILSGGCVAYVTCNGSVLYQFTGSCSAQLPITNLDYRGMISALISIGTTAVGVGSAIASGGITAPMAAVGIGSTANNVMNSKPNIQHGGSLGSTSGFLGTRTPYLIITRPRQCVPEGVEAFTGYPSFITDKLKNVTGFTKIDVIHLDNVAITQAEKSELLALLREGVII